jgi:hypothetical protein
MIDERYWGSPHEFQCEGCGKKKRRTQTEIDRDSGELIWEDALCDDCASADAYEITQDELVKMPIHNSYKN